MHQLHEEVGQLVETGKPQYAIVPAATVRLGWYKVQGKQPKEPSWVVLRRKGKTWELVKDGFQKHPDATSWFRKNYPKTTFILDKDY